MIDYECLKNNFFIMCGPNVIESEEQIMLIAKNLKKIFSEYDITFIFKTSFDKANRSSIDSYRGLGINKGLSILKKVKEELNIPIVTDIHEPYQAELVSSIVDVIQIPAFLCRQTDLLEAAAKTGKIIHVKKGQFCTSEQMHKCKEKLINFGNPNVILCERGTFFGYQDLVVDFRNLKWLKSSKNLTTMDITHCLQQPSQTDSNGIVKSGGLREFIPLMAKLALASNVNGLFMEVHTDPDNSKCDAPTQWDIKDLKKILDLKEKYYHKTLDFNNVLCCIPARLKSTRLPDKLLYKINNKTIINHVFDNVSKSSLINNTIILTDSNLIKENVINFGGESQIIDEHCINGTDRIIKYLKKSKITHGIVVNVQGDEPFINYQNIDLAINNFFNRKNNNVVCSTLYYETNDINEINNSNRGKCVLDKQNNIVYCSRSPIPTNKHGKVINNYLYKIHIGIFVYDISYLLNKYQHENTSLQLEQDIEWLKIIEQGYKINAVKAISHEIGIDTIDDYNYLKQKYEDIN